MGNPLSSTDVSDTDAGSRNVYGILFETGARGRGKSRDNIATYETRRDGRHTMAGQ